MEAPALRGLSWIKGDPVSVEVGKVVVVEFWATWCTVCRASVPTLTKLQRKSSPDLFRVVGIASARFDRPRQRVEDFVAEWSPRIGYTIAWDAKETAAVDWLDAAGQRGLPVTFVVDQERRVAWIGTPLDGLGDVLDRIKGGTFDIDVARVVFGLHKELAKAQVRNDHAAILDISARWIDVEPGSATPWISRFKVLANSVTDVDAALACTRAALKRLANAPGELARFANEGLFAAPDATACHALGLQTIRLAFAERGDDPKLAMAYFSALAATRPAKKNEKAAIQAARTAVELAADDAAMLASLANYLVDPRYGRRFAHESLSALRRAIEIEPDNHMLDRAEFDIVASVLKDDAAASTVGERLLHKAKRDEVLLNEFAWNLLDSPSYRGRFDALALSVSEVVHALPNGKSWMFVDTLARAKFVNGYLDEALALQRRAVEECDMLRYIGDVKSRLKVYERAAAEKRK